MMAKELNIQKMKVELIEIYEGFIKNPNNPVIQREAYKMYADYSTATDILLNEPISISINFLSEIIQYNTGIFDKEEIKQSAREILKELKKEK